MSDVVREGKAREIGCSNFTGAQLREAAIHAPSEAAQFVSIQNEYSLLDRTFELEVLRACDELNVVLLPYFPLFHGLLTGKYRYGQAVPNGSRMTTHSYAWIRDAVLAERNLETVERLIAFAEGRGHSVLELAFSWLLSRSFIPSVIAGATSEAQVRKNATAGRWRLTDDDAAIVDTLTKDFVYHSGSRLET